MSEDADASDKPQIRMALRPKAEPGRAEVSAADRGEDSGKRPMLLRKPEDSPAGVTGAGGPAITASDLLNEANRPQLLLERQLRRHRRFWGVIGFLLLSVVLAAGSYYYACMHRDWPLLESHVLYAPFIACVLLSAMLCVGAYAVWKRERRFYLGIFNLALALVLLVFNLKVYQVASQQREWSPWLENSASSVILSHELLASLRPGYPQAYSDWFEPANMQADLASLPRTHWRGVYQAYLSAEEMADLNYLNIEDYVPVVVRRAQADADSVWAQTAQAYQKNKVWVHMVRAAVAPYTLSFRWLR